MKAATLHWYRTRSDASPLGFELRADHRGRTWRMYRLADSKWRVRPTDRPQTEATFHTPEEARKWASHQAALNPRKERYQRNPQRRTDRKATFRRGQKVALRRPIQPAAAGSVFTVAEVDTKRWKIPRYRLPVGWVSQKDLVAVAQKNPKGLTGDEAYQAQELRLFIDRDPQSRAQRETIEAKLNDLLAMNRYDIDAAQDFFDPLVKDAASRAGLGTIKARVRNYVSEELAYDLQWEYDAAGRLELATYHELARPYHNPERSMPRQIKNPERDKSFYRRNLIIDPDLVERASHWHGGQGTALYSFTSSAHSGYVSPSMIEAAIGDLEYAKGRTKSRKDRKELDYLIGELDGIMNFPSEYSTKEHGVGDVDEGYDERGMKDDEFEGNPVTSADVEARELVLFIENDEPLYRMWQAIVRNMWKHTKRGRFDFEKSVKGFMHLADAGAQKYAKEFGGTSAKWYEMFDVPTRRLVAKDFAESFRDNSRDEIEYAPEGLRHNPESDVFREFATPDGTEVLWIGASEVYVLVSDQGALLSREILLAAATPDELDAALREYNPRKQNPSRRRRNGAGLGALIGSTIGAVVGFGFSSIPLAGVGSLIGGTVGGYFGAPKDRRKRGAAGGAIGSALLGPIGAGVGGYIGGRRPDADYGRRNNPEKNPAQDYPEAASLDLSNSEGRAYRRMRSELDMKPDDAWRVILGHRFMTERHWSYGWQDEYDPDTNEKINAIVLVDENENELDKDWEFTFSDIGQYAKAGELAYYMVKEGMSPNPSSFPHIDAIEVIDTLNDQQIQYHRADEKGRERFEKAIARYSKWGDRYVVQGLLNDGTVVIDNQGIGGEIRVLRNPASCGCSHARTSSVSRRIANP